MSSYSLFSGLKIAISGTLPPGYQEMLTGQDLVIKFFSAEVCFYQNKFISKLSFLEFT